MIQETNLRKDSFDSIKGLACIGVVFIHVLFPEPLKTYVKCMMRFSVPVFFLTSGFFFTEDGLKCSPEKMVKKTRHIMHLILNCALFFALFTYIYYSLENPNWTMASYLKERATAGKLARFFITNDPLGYSHLWFLLNLLYIYLFSQVFFANSKRFDCAGWLGFILLVGYMLLQEFAPVLRAMHLRTAIQIPESSHYIYFCNLFLFRGLSFFLIGIALRRNEKKILKWKLSKSWLLFLFISLIAVSAWEWTKTNDYTQYYVSSILASLILMTLAIKYPSWHPPVLHYLGSRLSIYIYIFHIPVQRSFDLLLKKQHLSKAPIIIWTRPFIILAITIVFSICFLQIRKMFKKIT